jgi:hypothetical protein
MRRLLMAGLAVLALAFTPALRALDEPPEAKAKQTPQQQFQTVLNDYQKAMQEFSQAYSQAKTPEEKNKLFQEKYLKTDTYAARFLAIAEKNIDDPAGIDALVWAVRLGSGQAANAKTIETLVMAHADSPKIGGIMPMLANSYSPWVEGLLRKVAEKNPDRTSRAQASMALAQFLKNRTELIRTLKENPQWAKQIEPFRNAQGLDKDTLAKLKASDPDALAAAQLAGHLEGLDKDTLAKLEASDPDALAKETETLFEKIANDYGDVSSGRDTYGKLAAAELNEIRNLGIGKPCPDITGDDIDGKSFKLSDYKGKVVVVDFWGDW